MTDKKFMHSMKLAGLSPDDKDAVQIRNYVEGMLDLIDVLKNQTEFGEDEDSLKALSELRDDSVEDADGRFLLNYAERSNKGFFVSSLAVKHNE